MPYCEDYPACGHGPAPYGDGGGCPDEDGCFDCVLCGAKLPAGNHSSICDACLHARRYIDDPDEMEPDY